MKILDILLGSLIRYFFIWLFVFICLVSKNKPPVICLGLIGLLVFFLIIKPVFITPMKDSHLIPIERLWSDIIYHYYNGSVNGALVHTQIELPSPYYKGGTVGSISNPYYKIGPEEVWNQNGWWQNQWRSYKANKPSVYTNDIPIPTPYSGPNILNTPPALCFYTDKSNNSKTYII